jgi:hypothetical protein
MQTAWGEELQHGKKHQERVARREYSFSQGLFATLLHYWCGATQNQGKAPFAAAVLNGACVTAKTTLKRSMTI